MENKEEMIFILHTEELRDGGFDGSFNDFADELEDAGAVVSGEYDEDGVPVMTVYGISTDEINDMLSSHGVDNPEEYTSISETGDEIDFDELDVVDDDDDEEIEIVDDDEDDDEIVEIDDEIIEESLREMRTPRNRTPRRFVSNRKSNALGTQNLSESTTRKILNEVKDKAIFNRIMESVAFDAKIEGVMESYKAPLPFSGIKVNGKECNSLTIEEINEMLTETKINYKKYYKKYKTLNESESDKTDKFKTVLRKQHKLIQLLESLKTFRSGKLFEDDAMGGNDSSNELGDQTATLTAIVFKVKNADKFIQTLVDNGVPQEALEKVETEDATGSDASPDDQMQQDDAMGGQPDAMGGGMPAAPAGPAPAGGGNPFESLSTRLTSKLNEDENPFGDSDQPSEDSGVDPLNTESHDNAPEGEEVRLVDTSYASKVQQILQDVYGYSKDNFEDKIGGQIEDEGSEPATDDADGSDGSVDDTNPEKDGTEEEISPEDIFGDLDI